MPPSRRVLLLDDDRGVLAALERAFQREGWIVVPASSPEVALSRLRGGAGAFDLVVVDVFLGGQTNGFQVARRARALQPQAGILVISSLLGAEAPRTKLPSHRVEFLKKPFGVGDLLAAAGRLAPTMGEEDAASAEHGAQEGTLGPGSRGSVLLVTGGSRGIGAATARLASERGWAVGVNFRADAGGAEEVVADIRGRGGRAVAVQADVSSEDDVERLFRTVDEELGRLGALVNNAGTLEPQMRVEEMGPERLQRILATNVVGTILCAREAVRRMSTRRGGTGGAVVNVSSAAARTGSPGEYVDYAASKGAVDTFTRGLAREVAGEGIRVNAVRPAFIRTEIHARGGEPGRLERVRSSIPMGRGGEPEEVARAILWLLSDEASYATGTFLDLAGGV